MCMPECNLNEEVQSSVVFLIEEDKKCIIPVMLILYRVFFIYFSSYIDLFVEYYQIVNYRLVGNMH